MSATPACGNYDLCWARKAEPIRRFLTKLPGNRFEMASCQATLTGFAIETDDAGVARWIAPLRLGGALREAVVEYT